MNNKAAMLGLAVVAFLVAAVLVIMIFRMLFGGRLRMPGGRTRQARLGIVDAFDLDRQRQLIIVRRDNVEHLIMIGGPNDLVVEAEIIRAEARDVRDTRREPGLAPGYADGGRIPAPLPSLEPAAPSDPAPRPADEPLLPLPLPTAASSSVDQDAVPTRGPTFPLPPRRPAPAPERRPAPPPRLPESVSRGDDVPALAGQPASLAPAPPQPVPPPAPTRPPSPPQAPPAVAQPVAPAGPAAQPPAGPASAPPQRPPFLKPAAPRPPIRPLQRTTSPTPGAPRPMPGAASAPNPPAAASLQPAAPKPPAPPVSPRPAPPPPAAPHAVDSQDGLESLEEEMAKLLGRGS